MVLVLTGSPNTKGNTMQVLQKILENCDEEIVYYNAYQLQFAPCTDCKFCSYKKGCKYSDGMDKIYQDLERAETLIIASPMYFATLSGEMVNLLSRFQTYYAGKYVRHEKNPQINKGVFIVTAGGYWEPMFNGVKETFRIMKLLFNINDFKSLYIPNCDEENRLSNQDVLKQIDEIKRFLNC